MKIRYVWPKSDVFNGGILSSTLQTCKLTLVRDSWNNRDYLRTKFGEDCFCITATKPEIEKHILHMINSNTHRQIIIAQLRNDKLGLPFLVTRDLKYIQMLERLPWQEIGKGNTSYPAPPFELFNATIKALSILDVIPMPNQKLERHRKVYHSHVKKKISVDDALQLKADEMLMLGS